LPGIEQTIQTIQQIMTQIVIIMDITINGEIIGDSQQKQQQLD
jgi:hypothetical protein